MEKESSARSGGAGDVFATRRLGNTGMAEGCAFRLHATIDAVDGDAWDELLAVADADVMMSRRFLRVVEGEHIFGSQPHYLVLYDPATSQPIGATVFTVLPVDIAAASGSSLRQMVASIRRVTPHFLEVTVAVCGLPLSLGQSSIMIRPGADDVLVLKAVDVLLQRTAQRARTSVLVYKEFGPHDIARLDALLDSGYRRVENLPTYRFPPRFRDFEEYVRAVRSTYRYTIRQSQKKLRDAQVTIEALDDPEQIASWYTDEIHQLYLAVEGRADYKFELLTANFFRALARAFPGEFTLVAARNASGKVIGFLSSLCALGNHHMLYVGMDYTWNAVCDLYFNLIYADLDQALRHSLRRIDVAQTADTFKARLGCQREARYLYVGAKGRVLPTVVRLGSRLLSPQQDTVPEFRVFPSLMMTDSDL